MNIKAVFFDIDGTLVSFKTHSIPQSTKDAINQLRQKEIKVIISTGRAFHDIDNLEGLEFDGFITANGACCMDARGEIIVQNLISKDNLEKLALYLQENPFPCSFMTPNGNYINYVDDSVRALSKLVNVPMPSVKPVSEIIENEVFQIDAYVDQEQESELMKHVLTDCESSRWYPTFTDINAMNNNKATGIDQFLVYFNIQLEHTIAFGDGGNDISMLKHAGIGIAMGNANDDVKKIADYVTSSVDEEGISNALKYFNIL